MAKTALSGMTSSLCLIKTENATLARPKRLAFLTKAALGASETGMHNPKGPVKTPKNSERPR